MTDATYHIIDEPRPGSLSKWATNPFWILLTLMLGGAWIGWCWFAFNAVAIGSATLKKEIAWMVGSMVAVAAAVLIIGAMLSQMGDASLGYWIIALPVLKIGAGYYVYVMQYRSFALYEYYGGTVRNGMFVTLLAFLSRGYVYDAIGQPFWQVVLM